MNVGSLKGKDGEVVNMIWLWKGVWTSVVSKRQDGEERVLER